MFNRSMSRLVTVVDRAAKELKHVFLSVTLVAVFASLHRLARIQTES